MAKHQTTKKTSQPADRSVLPLALWGAAFFLLLCLSGSGAMKMTTALALALVALLLFASAKELGKRLCLPFLTLSGLVLMCGLSTAYALSGKFALNEFIKVALAYCVFLLLLLFPGKQADPARRGATILSVGTALASLLSIDLISTRILSGAFQGVMGLFGPEYSFLAGIEAGVRITSIFTNPNIFAGCVGLGLLLGLGLSVSATNRRERYLHLSCLFLNALAFVLAFSMGASGTILVAFLVVLAFEQQERRAPLLILMLETMAITLCASFPIFLTSFDAWDGIQPIPLLCAVGGSALLCLVDRTVGTRAAALLGRYAKATLALILAVVVAAGIFATVALNVTGPAKLDAGELLRRSAYPAPGTYQLACISSGPVTVTVESQNESDTMMHTSTVLYQGDAQTASFTVPEDSLVVYFNFALTEQGTVDQVLLQGDGGEETLKLGYPLLPGFIANRLQGLFANQNAIQRTVFFRDGLLLFQRSPIIGLGMGSFENAILGVQSFFYETKYVHNHYIQQLLETGVIGLALFVGTLALCALALWKGRKKEGGSPLLAALAGCLVFMAGHAATEVIFSASVYLPIAFGVLALILLACGDALPLPAPWTKTPKPATILLRSISGLLCIFLVLLSGNLAAKSITRGDTSNPFGNLRTAILLDRYEWADHMLSYVYNAPAAGSAAVLDQAKVYAQRLSQVNSNTIPYYLGQFYLTIGETQQGIDALNQYVAYTSSKSQSWNDAFSIMLEGLNSADNELLIPAIQDLYASYLQWNDTHLGTLALSDEIAAMIQPFVGQVS